MTPYLVALMALGTIVLLVLQAFGIAPQQVTVHLDSPYLLVPAILLFGLIQEARICARYH
jgi:hypothetical protein